MKRMTGEDDVERVVKIKAKLDRGEFYHAEAIKCIVGLLDEAWERENKIADLLSEAGCSCEPDDDGLEPVDEKRCLAHRIGDALANRGAGRKS